MSAHGVRRVRPAAVAGTFYPADPRELRAEIDSALAAVDRRAEGAPAPKALVVPHAGYQYSAPVAASAFARIAGAAEGIKRVVLVGPSHRVPLNGLAVSTADAFETPLGTVPIDDGLRSVALRQPVVVADDRPHALEHSLEVQLPFLQAALGDFSLVPLVVGQASDAEVAEVLERLWGGDETLLVISSDLSHYYDYEAAKRMDAEACRAIGPRMAVPYHWGDIVGDEADARAFVEAVSGCEARLLRPGDSL